MSNRKLRVGELLRREISEILHTRFQDRAVMITITYVDVSPDNKNALAFFSVIETQPDSIRRAKQFLDDKIGFFKRELGKRIVLKSMPDIKFQFDELNQQGARINALIDELDTNGEPKPHGGGERSAER